MGIIAWIVVGAIAGWLAGMLRSEGSRGFLGNMLVGIVGGVVGGFVFGLFDKSGADGINLYSIIVATIGALIFLFIKDRLVK